MKSLSQNNIEHTKLVMDLAKPGEDIIESIDANKAHLLHMAVGICGEAGEIIDTIKKHVIYNQSLDEDNVIEELGDLMFYIKGIMVSLQIPLNQVLDHNIVKLRKRYGEKYSDRAAEERIDKCQNGDSESLSTDQ